jgi:SPP1 gp7 family putative phage head morphogenesis protein
MMSNQSDQALIDALTQHNTYLQRLSTTAVMALLQKFDQVSLQMLRILRDQLEELSEPELMALSGARYTTPQLKELQGTLKAWQQSISESLPELFTESAIGLAAYEVAYIYKLANKKAPAITGESQFKKANKVPYVGGKLLAYIFPDVAQDLRDKVERTIRDGISNGQTNQQIIQRIKGTKKLNYSDGLLDKTRTVIDSEVRTARAHLSSEVYLDTWKALGFEYTKDVATLDGRTTPLCASRDGRVQKLGDGHQKPPYHYRCRTVQVGCDADGDLSGVRPFVADDRSVKNIPKDERADKIGQTDANTTYKQWFDRQSAEYQKNWLGPKRYELYKKGDYPIDRFIDPLTGRKFTLSELRDMDEKIFKELKL